MSFYWLQVIKLSVQGSQHPNQDGGRMSDNLRTLGGGGPPAIPILKSIIGTAGKPKTTLCGWNLVLFCCVFACKTTNQ